MYIAQTLKDRIKNQCKAKDISIKTMLSECGLSINAISQINNTGGMYSFNLAKIADYLDCSVDYLLGRTDDHCISSQSDTSLTAHEQEIVAAYRSHPEARPAVDKLLGVTDNGTVLLYTAAKSSDNVPPERIELPQKRWEEFENTPKADSTEPN